MEHHDTVVGREDELRAVGAFLADGPPGAAALVLEGAAGIGKTTVWEASIADARGRAFEVLAARPSSEEAQLGFSGLADLLAGVGPAVLESLPAPQRRALEAALLVGDGDDSTDGRAVAAALLRVLRSLAAAGRVLVAVDDAQWLDPATAGALSYAVRRVRDEPVRLLLARRAPARPTALERATLPTTLPVSPLTFGAVCRLLQLRLGLTFSRATSRRIYEASGGNPLFALELARVVDQRGGRLDAADDVALPAAVETALEVRLRSLSPSVRRALLAAELAGSASAEELDEAAGANAVDDAVDAGVLAEAEGRIRPSHPLIGAAAKARARPAELRELHRRLAGAALDEERVARHLALAQRRPDEETAATVAAAAAHASRRGAAASAAELGDYALRLTHPASERRVDRLLAAAEYRLAAGELGRVRSLLQGSVDTLPPGAPRARALLLLSDADAVGDESGDYLARALAEADSEPALRASVLAHLAFDTAVGGVTLVREAADWADDAARSAAAAGDPATELEALVAVMWLRHLRGLPSDEALTRLRSLEGTARVRVRSSAERAQAVRRIWRGELAEARTILRALLDRADESGEAEGYFVARLQLCELELRAGRLNDAAALLDEWAVQHEEPVGGHSSYVRCAAQLACGRGRIDQTRRLAAEAIAIADASGTPWQRLESLRALGTVELLAGRPAAATAALREVWDHVRSEGIDDPGAFPVGPELVEALAAGGDADAAHAVAEELGRLAAEQEHPWGLAAAARARGLVHLVRRSDAEAAFALGDAVARFERLELPFDRARTLAGLGVVLRRSKRLREGRAAMAQAAGIFSELGADGWAEQARAELARFGGRRSAAGLTPTEQRVAELVCRGLSNKQAAAELVVSVSAVERHLTRIYEKLGVRSRTELVRRLAEAPAQSVGLSRLPAGDAVP